MNEHIVSVCIAFWRFYSTSSALFPMCAIVNIDFYIFIIICAVLQVCALSLLDFRSLKTSIDDNNNECVHLSQIPIFQTTEK